MRKKNSFNTVHILIKDSQFQFLNTLQGKYMYQKLQVLIDGSNPDLQFLYEDALDTIRQLRKKLAMIDLEKEHPKLEAFIEP